MILDAIVKEDGTLIAKAPESLKGKKVRIKIILNWLLKANSPIKIEPLK